MEGILTAGICSAGTNRGDAVPLACAKKATGHLNGSRARHVVSAVSHRFFRARGRAAGANRTGRINQQLTRCCPHLPRRKDPFFGLEIDFIFLSFKTAGGTHQWARAYGKNPRSENPSGSPAGAKPAPVHGAPGVQPPSSTLHDPPCSPIDRRPEFRAPSSSSISGGGGGGGP